MEHLLLLPLHLLQRKFYPFPFHGGSLSLDNLLFLVASAPSKNGLSSEPIRDRLFPIR